LKSSVQTAQAEAVTYAGQHQAMRQRTYSVLSDIKTAHRFAPTVVPPAETHDGHPGITWEAFHKVCSGGACYPICVAISRSVPWPRFSSPWALCYHHHTTWWLQQRGW
jgi:hypothetical protein